MKKLLLIILVVFVVVAVGGGFLVYKFMRQPLYTPGMVRGGSNLREPLATAVVSAANYWNVESDIRLYHFSGGKGRNVLVVHGGPGLPFEKPLPGLRSLTNRYTFHYYDQRGAGQSSRPITRFPSSNTWENMQTLDKTLGLGAQIADIERIRRLLGDDKLILVGHSFGGFLASLYAAEFPEHVQALVLVAPAELLIMPPESGGLFEQVRALLPETMKPEYDDYIKRYLDYNTLFTKSESELAALNVEFAKYYAIAAEKKGFKVASPSASAAGGWTVQAQYLSMGLEHDYRSALKSVQVPVLVLHGASDLQSEKASRAYSETFPKAEFHVINNAGHFSFDDQPDVFAFFTGEFLDRLK